MLWHSEHLKQEFHPFFLTADKVTPYRGERPEVTADRTSCVPGPDEDEMWPVSLDAPRCSVSCCFTETLTFIDTAIRHDHNR